MSKEQIETADGVTKRIGDSVFDASNPNFISRKISGFTATPGSCYVDNGTIRSKHELFDNRVTAIESKITDLTEVQKRKRKQLADNDKKLKKLQQLLKETR